VALHRIIGVDIVVCTHTVTNDLAFLLQLQAEIKIHRTLKHRHVCEYKHFFEDRQNCYILLELCHNQSMNEMIKRRKRLTEPETAYIMRQLLEAMQYLHDQLVIHRDLKLGNLFLDRNLNVKLGDLGLASRLESAEEKRKTICGTPNYIAPEVIQGDRATRGHSFEVDIWSMGVILYTCLVGKPPYEAKDVKATYQRILSNKYSFPRDIPVSEPAKDIIRRMLQSRPEDRPSLSEIAAHPFFTESKIPYSLPSNATHVAPIWRENDFGELEAISKAEAISEAAVEKDTVVPKKPCLPLGSAQRRVFASRDVNVERGSERSERSKGSRDVPNAGKNVLSSVVNSGNRSPHAASSAPAPAFQVFDESQAVAENRKTTHRKLPQSRPVEDELVAKTASLSIRTQEQNPYHTTDPSPRQPLATPAGTVTPENDALILHNMIDRIDTVLQITATREYSSVPANSPSMTAFSRGGPTKWVSRYVDYTSKYGLGFLLSDGRYVIFRMRN
jgi:serine/threonine protein kinase